MCVLFVLCWQSLFKRRVTPCVFLGTGITSRRHKPCSATGKRKVHTVTLVNAAVLEGNLFPVYVDRAALKSDGRTDEPAES